MENKLLISKIRNVKTPVRAHSLDAGIDFFIPEDITEAEFLEHCKTTGTTPKYTLTEDGFIKEIHLNSGDAALIPSGVKMVVPKDHMVQFINKSGIASKFGLLIGACVIDSGYSNQVFINLHAQYNRTITLTAGQKVAQAVIIPIKTYPTFEVSENIINEENQKLSSRGEGGFGSTGN